MSLCGGHKWKSPSGFADTSHSGPTSRTRKLATLSTWSELMGRDNPIRRPRNQKSTHLPNASSLQRSATASISLEGMVYNMRVRSTLLSRREPTVTNGIFQ